MGEEMALNLSSFQNKLSSVAFACFRLLFNNARERISVEGPLKAYEMPLSVLLDRGGAADVEEAAQSIRDILECMVEMTKGDYMYFYPPFSFISIEKGIVRYSIPAEIEQALPALSLA